MRHESKALEELHKIREKLYEETKHLSPEQHAAKIEEEAGKIRRQYNLHLPRPEKARK